MTPYRFAISLLSTLYVLAWLRAVGYEHGDTEFGEAWRWVA